MKIDKSLILNKIKSYYGFKSEVEFANFLGIPKTTLSSWHKRNMFDIDLLYSKCEQISGDWLLTGKGPMLKEHEVKPPFSTAGKDNGIPLIPVEAFGGIADNSGYSVNLDTIQERYVVPLFEGKGVDFMIPVRGASMYPKYSSGDVVACRFVKELLFIQWNKVYVIDSQSQGAIIKRLIKSDDPDKIICRSDNKEYPDFEVPMSDIHNIALVVGCIRLE